MAFVALIKRGEHIIPIVKGGSGPDADCMMTWNDARTAAEAANEVLLAAALPVLIVDLDDADVV